MESALRRQMDYLTRKLSEVSGEDPVAQLIAFGKAGVEWAVELIPDLTNLATESEDPATIVFDDAEFDFTLEEEEITP